MGYAASYSTAKGRRGPINLHPLLAHDLAAAFPDVNIIFDHGGVQGWWSDKLQEECLHVAAAHDNVYLETGLWWRELYEKALADPNVGADKLMWGTDWGASLPFHYQPGRTPPSYPLQIRKDGTPAHHVDFWGWSFRELIGPAHPPGRPEPDHRRERLPRVRAQAPAEPHVPRAEAVMLATSGPTARQLHRLQDERLAGACAAPTSTRRSGAAARRGRRGPRGHRGIADLPRLPTCDRPELQADQDEHPPLAATLHPASDWVRTFTTSGTSGRRLRRVLSARDWDLFVDRSGLDWRSTPATR